MTECPGCNEPVAEGERFCGACGIQVSTQESTGAIQNAPLARRFGLRRCIGCGHVGLSSKCLLCDGVMKFIPLSELQDGGTSRWRVPASGVWKVLWFRS